MIKPTNKQLEFLNSNSDITVWSAGRGAGTSVLLLLLAYQSEGDTYVIDPLLHPTSLRIAGDCDSELVESRSLNCFKLINGNTIHFSKTFSPELYVKKNVVILNANALDNSQAKFISNYSHAIKIFTYVTEDSKRWIRKLVLGLMFSGAKHIWFDGNVISLGNRVGFSRSASVVHASVHDNPALTSNCPNYIFMLKNCGEGKQKQVFGEWL